MQIKLSARHGHLTDDHQREIRQKAEKLLHIFDRISMIEVTVDLGEAFFGDGDARFECLELTLFFEGKFRALWFFCGRCIASGRRA